MKKEKEKYIKIKDFEHWILFLHENQGYLGRMYLLSIHSQKKDFSEISFNEREEFFLICKILKKILNSLFQPDRINYACLCNVFKCLHIHIVPRYKEPRHFDNVIFYDHRWGKNYAPYDKTFKTSNNLKLSLKEKIKKMIENESPQQHGFVYNDPRKLDRYIREM